jgi:hypothetical protein
LIISINAEGLSSVLEVDEDTLSSVYRTEFDRVFLFKWPDTVHSLRLRVT